MPTRIGLVQCGSAKQDLDGETVPAKDLYTAPYFGLKAWVGEHCCDEWWIVSGKFGLLHPDAEIAAYECYLTEQSDAYQRRWLARVSGSFPRLSLSDRQEAELVVLVGSTYLDLNPDGADRTLRAVIERQPADAWYPFDDLGDDYSRGMFGQQQWLADCRDAGELVPPEPREVRA